MKAPWSGQLSATKTGWLLALLFFGWLAYFFIPAPKPETKPPPPLLKPPPSRLVALGLPDNIDFEHLPEYFALYADQAEWKDDKTIFAYWNPGSNNYSYFFEAMRVNGGYHFKTISEPHDWEFSENESVDIPMRFHRSFSVITINPSLQEQSITSCQPPLEQKKRIEIELVKSPPPELKLPPLDVEQKK